MQNRPKQKYKLDTNGLFARHLQEGFLAGCVGFKPGSEAVGFALSIIHIVLSPITCPLYSGIRTLIDYKTRKLDPQEELIATDQRLKNCSSEEFDHYIQKISEYKPKSSTSRDLLETIKLIDIKIKKSLEDDISNEEKRLISLKKQEKIQIFQKEDPFAKQIQLTNDNILLNEDEAQNIKQQLSEYTKNRTDVLMQDKRQQQSEWIHQFLSDTINLGTRLENIIVEEAKKLTI